MSRLHDHRAALQLDIQIFGTFRDVERRALRISTRDPSFRRITACESRPVRTSAPAESARDLHRHQSRALQRNN